MLPASAVFLKYGGKTVSSFRRVMLFKYIILLFCRFVGSSTIIMMRSVIVWQGVKN